MRCLSCRGSLRLIMYSSTCFSYKHRVQYIVASQTELTSITFKLNLNAFMSKLRSHFSNSVNFNSAATKICSTCITNFVKIRLVFFFEKSQLTSRTKMKEGTNQPTNKLIRSQYLLAMVTRCGLAPNHASS